METNDALIPTPLILIVDDDRATRTLLKVAMEEEGYRVIEAKDGEQCLIEYHRHHPDMVLLDALMPEMDGFTCCQELQKVDRGYETPILMITALDDQDSIDRAFAVGAIDYITKPIHWAVLAQRVKRLLTTSKALEQLKTLQEKQQQHQQWLQLFQKLTHPSVSFQGTLVDLLSQARQVARAERAILYSFKGDTRLESLAENIASTRGLSTQDIGLETYYQSQYQQGQTAVIADLLTSKLPKAAIAPLIQLDTRAVLMLPLQLQDTWGLLCIHRSQIHHWEDWEIDQFTLLANLLVRFYAGVIAR